MALASLVKLNSTVLLICKLLWSPPIYIPELKRCSALWLFLTWPSTVSWKDSCALCSAGSTSLVPSGVPWRSMETSSVSGNDDTILQLWFCWGLLWFTTNSLLWSPPVNFLQNILSCLHYFLPSVPRKTQVRDRDVSLCFTNEPCFLPHEAFCILSPGGTLSIGHIKNVGEEVSQVHSN